MADNSAANEPARAVAYKARVCTDRIRGPAQVFQSMIARSRNIAQSIDQRSVEIEHNRLILHGKKYSLFVSGLMFIRIES